MENSQGHASLGFEHALKVIRRRGWIIVLCIVLAGAAAFAISHAQTKEYTATAALLFKNQTVAEQASGVQATVQTDPQGQRDTNLTLVQLGDLVAQRTASALRLGLTSGEIKSAVTASPQGQSNIVLVAATWTNPVVAAKIANAYTKAFVQQQRQSDQATIQSGIALVRQQYTSLSPADQRSAQGQTLLDRMESLRVLKALQGDTQVVQSASVPSAPSSPKVFRNTLLGAVLGLFLGLGVAYLLDRLDRRLREPEDIETALGLPMLGMIPRGAAASTSGAGDGMGLEPFRMLRAHLRYFNVDRELRTLLVTSALPSEGKTTVSSNLAAAAASTGTKTLLVETDLRRPVLTQTLGLTPSIGLAGALVGAGSLEEAIRSAGHGDDHRNGNLGGVPLDVLPAGAIPPNPAELLESHAMEVLLAQAKEHYELVILDTAPLSVVADAIPLMTRVDGVIIVARVGLSTRDAAERLRARLENLEAPVLGVVANDVRSRLGEYGYGYMYTYGDETSGTAEPESEQAAKPTA
jgi:capsular exopolysaccharide synthesis family protein